MILYLVCDISGSVLENGKHLITRGLVRAIEQYHRLGYGNFELKLVAWNNKARLIEWIPDDEYPQEMFDCKNGLDATSLLDILPEQSDRKVLFITDGFWTRDVEKKLKRWKSKLSQDTLRIIKIGADANTHLKGADIFSAEDLFAVLDNWLERGTA